MLICLEDPCTAVLTYRCTPRTMPTWGSCGRLGRPASRITPLPVNPPQYTGTLGPPTIEAHIYSLGPGRRVWYVQLQGGIPDQLSPFQFGNSTTRKYDTIGAPCENTSLSIPAYITSLSLHSLPSPLPPSLVCTTSSRSGRGAEGALSQVKSRKHVRGTLHPS